MDFYSKHYLPSSEKRIEHLQKIINGKPVAILAAGPSIRELEKRIGGLSHIDICYFGLSSFIQEKYILQQINRHLSVYMHIPHSLEHVIDFLNRNEDNLFVTDKTFANLTDSDFNLGQFVNKYEDKIIFFHIDSDKTVPSSNFPLHFNRTNSLLVLIQLAIIGKASKIILFGADGYCDKNIEEYYYRPGEYGVAPRQHLIRDTHDFNSFAPLAIRNVCKTYNLAPIQVFNCSEDSFYTPFPKISYADAFGYLIEGKQFNRASDLRVPKVSVISIIRDPGDSLPGTIKNINAQSYSNHEHVIVYDQANNEICKMISDFPYVRWIQEKNIDFLQMFKKGISSSRGEYIFYCRDTDGYLDQDWFNTCVDILENNPDISLVWSLSQPRSQDGGLGEIDHAYLLQDLPSQKEYFIYYWLKNKNIFSERNFCVRKRVLEECFPFADPKISDERQAWLIFNYRFNSSGYLPYFVPITANYYRRHNGIDECTGPNMRIELEAYLKNIEQYKKQIIRRKIIFRYQDGSGSFISGSFSLGVYLFYDIGRYIKLMYFRLLGHIKSRLPNICLVAIKKCLFFWRTYGWGIFSVVISRTWYRLTEKVKYQPVNKE